MSEHKPTKQKRPISTIIKTGLRRATTKQLLDEIYERGLNNKQILDLEKHIVGWKE